MCNPSPRIKCYLSPRFGPKSKRLRFLRYLLFKSACRTVFHWSRGRVSDTSGTCVKTADFDYDLPPGLIAQHPAARREDARLLVVHRARRALEHRRFFELPQFLRSDDLLIRNTARVRPARLFAQRSGGGGVECLLLRPETASVRRQADGVDATSNLPQRNTTHHAGRFDKLTTGASSPRLPTPPVGLRRTGEAGASQAVERWWCLLRPGRRLPPGAEFGVAGEFTAQVAAKSPTAEYLVAFTPARAGESVATIAERLGRVPLPPYIQRPAAAADDAAATEDRTRYQTVFANRAQTVAVAAPTAGLHFSEDLLARLARDGIGFADVILHVGLGTFRPIETEDVASHPIHRETIEIPASTRRALAAPPSGRRIAVGTTSVRAVEHYARQQAGDRAMPEPGTAYVDEADLFIHPPATFRIVEGLITNFHLPRSTLLCLVAAFLTPGSTEGVSWLREIYAEAVRERYRFLSYGDAMLIL